MRIAFESAGDIRSVDLLASLVSLWRVKASGSLRFSRPGATAGFELLGGEVVLSLSSQPQYDAAAILSRAGKLDAAALEKLPRPPGGDASLAALQAGLISVKEWRWGQKIRAIEILSELLGWLEGEYSWDPDARPAASDWTLPVPRLVLELFLRSRDRTLVEHYLGPSDLPLLRAGSFHEEFETFGLTSDAVAVVALIDGRASAEEIAERAPAEEFAVLKLLAALTTLGLVHPAEATPEPGREAPPPIRPEAEALETAPQAEVEAKPEPEEAAQLGAGEEIEPEPEGPAAPVEQPPEAPEKESAPQAEEEWTPPAAWVGSGEGMPESAREPPTEPAVPRPRVPADVMPERPELLVPTEARDEDFESEFPASQADATPPDAAKRGSGALLGGLLAVLVVAVAVLVIVRSRRASPERPVATNVQPTGQENPVFPPAETAVPLPTHGTQTVRPSPVVTRLAVIPPTPAATVAPGPTPPPTRVLTLPPPTKPSTHVSTPPPPTRPPTQVPTRLPTRAEPTRPPTPVPTRVQPTRQPTRVPTRPEPARPTPLAAPTAAAAVRGEAARAVWIARAERDRRAMSKRRNVRYAVQLELACEIPTLENAWNWDKPPGTMWLLTTSYRGRTCFRVMWGRFVSLPEAREAKARVPGFFVAPGNRPAIVSVR
jgi:hypothetical protein